MVHAGIAPAWTIDDALGYAAELSRALRAPDHLRLLSNMYGNEPDEWRDSLTGLDRLRFITNAFTRMRYCHATDGWISRNPGHPANRIRRSRPGSRCATAARIEPGSYSDTGRRFSFAPPSREAFTSATSIRGACGAARSPRCALKTTGNSASTARAALRLLTSETTSRHNLRSWLRIATSGTMCALKFLEVPDPISPRLARTSMSALPIMIVAAMTENRVIGRDGGDALATSSRSGPISRSDDGQADHHGATYARIAWKSPRRTVQHRPLPPARLSRRRASRRRELTVVHSLKDAFRKAREVASSSMKEIAIIGGASVYEQALPYASHLHLTRVHATIDGDVRFPEVNLDEWHEVSRVERPADARNPYDMSFIELTRRSAGPVCMGETM